ncbi:MAG TPA: glycosyltransferase family 39 protein [Rugosimonospora sp.]|jgi:hypothetical protein
MSAPTRTLASTPVQTSARSRLSATLRAAGPRAAGLPAVLLLAAAVRLAYLAGDRANFNGDEAVTGIMVQHILRGEAFLFYPGQRYGGTLEVYLQALGYLVFRLPQNPLTLRLAQVVLSVASTALVYLCARRMLPGGPRRRALLAAAFFAVGPWFNVVGGATAWGFYSVGVTLGMGALYCALRLGADRSRDVAWALGLGLCAGLGFWNSLTSVYLVLPALVWAMPYLRRLATVCGATLGVVAGAAPALIVALRSGELPVPTAPDRQVGLGHRVANLADPLLRQFLGIAYAHGDGGLPRPVQYLIVVGVAAAYLGCLWRRRLGLAALLGLAAPLGLRRGGREPVDLLLVAPVLVAVLYVATSMAWYTGTPRYLFTAYPLLALSVAALLPYRRPVASHVAYAVVLSLSAVLCLGFFRTAPHPSLTERDAVLRGVVARLVSEHETRVYADYSTGMALQYLAGDRLDVAVCYGATRFAHQRARVRAAPDPVYVDSPLAGSGLLDDPPDTIGTALLANHATFRTTRVGFVTIYDRVTPAGPPAFCR